MEHEEALGGDERDHAQHDRERMSVMITSTTKGLIFRVKMLSLSMHLLQPLNSLSSFIGSCVIGILMSNSRMTWLSTCVLILATSRSMSLILVMHTNFDWVIRQFDIVFLSCKTNFN